MMSTELAMRGPDAASQQKVSAYANCVTETQLAAPTPDVNQDGHRACSGSLHGGPTAIDTSAVTLDISHRSSTVRLDDAARFPGSDASLVGGENAADMQMQTEPHQDAVIHDGARDQTESRTRGGEECDGRDAQQAMRNPPPDHRDRDGTTETSATESTEDAVYSAALRDANKTRRPRWSDLEDQHDETMLESPRSAKPTTKPYLGEMVSTALMYDGRGE